MQLETDSGSGMDVQMTSASTTIDPSVVESRIRQSVSLQKSDQAMDETDQPVFPEISASQANGNKVEYRRIRCPAHRYTPLREHWEQILTPLVEYLKLQVRIFFDCSTAHFIKKMARQRKKYPFPSECTLCCSWNFKPSGKPQLYKERNGATLSCSLMSQCAHFSCSN